MEEKIKQSIKNVLEDFGISTETISLEHPADMSHGDYSTNVALVGFKKLQSPPAGGPKTFAEEIVAKLREQNISNVAEISIAGPGFINFKLSPKYFTDELANVLADGEKYGRGTALQGKTVMVEYTQPNPFKPFHIGHLMSNAIGESLSRIVENQGAKVIRANYQGDIGLHVAKAIYGILKNPSNHSGQAAGAYPKGTPAEVAEYIGKCYSDASNLYDEDMAAKAEIDALNKKLYYQDVELWSLYQEGRQITLEAFEELYKMLGTKFDVYYFESAMAEEGTKLVEEFLDKGVFEKSDGAVVFHAEKYNPKLHTRVFLTSAGLAPYEAKEIGLTVRKFADYNPDISLVDTATEQRDYMMVVTEAIRQMFPDKKYAERMMHVTHGMMRFASGKMSSRKGNIITGESLVLDTVALISEKMTDRGWSLAEKTEVSEIVGVASIKYSILRSKIGSDIVYDVEKSISTEGDSGPYLQYALMRAKSVLEKAKAEKISPKISHTAESVGDFEKMIVRFPEVALRAWSEAEPHHLITYLTELASGFNSYYAQGKIVDPTDSHSPHKLAVTSAFATVMRNGLSLVGIRIPERM